MAVPICVDFDGTIVTHEFPDIGFPVPEALDYLRKWQGQGHKLILFTMRSGNQQGGDPLQEAVDYLEGEGIKFYGVNSNPDQHSWTHSPKAYGQIYIDDAAAGTPLVHPPNGRRPYVDWSVVGPLVDSLLGDA